MINTLICSIEKIININRFLKKSSIEINPDFIDNLKNNVSFTVEKDKDSVSKKIFTMFESGKYRTILKPLEDGNIIIYGDKGGWSKYAPHLTHLAFLIVLAGHLITSWTGLKINGFPVFAGQNAIFIPGTNMGIRINNVNFEYSPDKSRIKNYSADISIFENEKEIRNKEVKVNHPLSYRDNLTFYVLGYGYYQYRDLYVIVSINQDHGASTVLIASLLMLIGLYCTLFITYRRFWIVVLPSDIPERSQIKIGGTSDNINFDLEKKIKKFKDKINE
ncbi:cytochrome c biogenesis protein ResB [Candidatus Desantisbacteria bacterium]|nr:cytochrome c biogenesis protein ResB [Candidatus Desantisbacteria bacterium]